MVQLIVDIGLLKAAVEEIKKLQEVAKKQDQMVLFLTCNHACFSIETLIRDLEKFRKESF